MCRSVHTSLRRVSAELEDWNQGTLLYLITSKGLIGPTELRWSVICDRCVTRDEVHTNVEQCGFTELKWEAWVIIRMSTSVLKRPAEGKETGYLHQGKTMES